MTTQTMGLVLAAGAVAIAATFVAALPRKTMADRKRERAVLRDRLGLLPPLPDLPPLRPEDYRKPPELDASPPDFALPPRAKAPAFFDLERFKPRRPLTPEQEREDFAREVRRWD